jgi:hypothetical protein
MGHEWIGECMWMDGCRSGGDVDLGEGEMWRDMD